MERSRPAALPFGMRVGGLWLLTISVSACSATLTDSPAPDADAAADVGHTVADVGHTAADVAPADALPDASAPDASAPDAPAPDASAPDAPVADDAPETDAECQALTCAELGFDCGEAPDGCGGTLSCGSCTPPEVCGGGGTDNVCAAGNFTVTIALQGSPVASSSSVSVMATGAGPGVDHVSFYRITDDDARATDDSLLCSWPGAWETIDHDHPSGSWKPWVPPTRVGKHYIVVNLKNAANDAVCSGALALAQHLGRSCSVLAQQQAPCQGGFIEVDVLLPQPFDGGPHPNFVAYGSNSWTAKFYWREPTKAAEYVGGSPVDGLWVWSGPWAATGSRFVAYQKYWTQSTYPLKANGAYAFHEFERWDGNKVMGFPGKCHDALGAEYACDGTEASPDLPENRCFAASGCAAASHGVAWPNNQTDAFAAVDFYRQLASCQKATIVSYVKEWWSDAGSAFRQQRCAAYLPASLPTGSLANTICNASANAGIVYQRYHQPNDSGADFYGCEATIYAWGNASSPSHEAFRDGELRFSEYRSVTERPLVDHHWWNPECDKAFTEQRNWYYTGVYKLDLTVLTDPATP